MKQVFVRKRFHQSSLDLIELADQILSEYAAQGFSMTLRQIYYQLVARGHLPNKRKEYKRLGSILNKARLAGLIDWDHMVDRTRVFRSVSHWESPHEVLESAARQFRFDKWADQPVRFEAWIEKDALLGVIEPICRSLDITWFSCRGYSSQTKMYEAACRYAIWAENGQIPIILHLSDHDPSGVDMSRDLVDRLDLFLPRLGGIAVEVRRLALNIAQVQEYDPPPNPAKLSDSRARSYVDLYGYESWELDALDPATIAGLIRAAVLEERDEDAWGVAVAREDEARAQLMGLAEGWEGQ